MSEAHNIQDDVNLGGSGYQVQRARSSGSSILTNISEKISSGIEQLAGVIHKKSVEMSHDDKTAKYADYGKRTANALHSSANYIKQADLDQVQTDLRNTIKRNPERSLLVGLGVGILIGTVLRKKG